MALQTWRRFRLLILAGGLVPLSAARADLLEYVQKPEAHFAWKLKQKIDSPLGAIYDIELTSQTWEGIDWTHQLQVYQPKDVAPTPVKVPGAQAMVIELPSGEYFAALSARFIST